MFGVLLAQMPVSGRLLCLHCQSCAARVAVGARFISQTHYDVLEIDKSASPAQIRSAFLARSKLLHPDINRKDPKNHEKFVKVNEAYMVLSKPITRREYDLNLAARIQLERQVRSASSSHGYGSSAWPGTNSNQYEAEQQRFWDETIWHMRDKSQDKDFEGRPYYSFTKMRRLSNIYIVLGCMAFMAFGALVHYVAIRKSREMHKAVLDEKDKINYSNLAKARSYARTHGNALQLQILKSKVNNKPLEGVGLSEQTAQDAFTPAKK